MIIAPCYSIEYPIFLLRKVKNVKFNKKITLHYFLFNYNYLVIKNKPNKPKKITIIDQDKSITTILDFILHQNGFEIQCFNENILESFISSPKPDLILLDQNIDNQSSSKLFKELSIQHTEIPVISMVGKKIKNNYKNSFKSVIGYIYKPLDTEEVVSKIKELLK